MKRYWSVLVLALVTTAARAQTSPLIIDQNRPDRTPPAAVAGPHVPIPKSAPQTPTSVTPFQLTAVQIAGASIDPARLAAATKPFIGGRIDAKGVQAIADVIANVYSHSDIALYTVVVPDQDFAGGVLRLAVVEGYVVHVDIQGDTTGDLSLVARYVQKLTQERPLRKATLQRYISLIRDIGGLTPDVQLLAGNAPGAVVMIVKLNQQLALFGLDVGNSGNPLLGRVELQGSVALFDALREGEVTKFTYATSTEPQRFQYVSLSNAEPIDDDGTMAQLAGGYLHTRPLGSPIGGDAETLQLAVSHPLIRSYDENLFVSGDIDGLNSTNALIGQFLADERVRALRASASYSLSAGEHVFSASTTLSQGLDILGAQTSIVDRGDRSFTKLNFALGYNQLIDPEWIVRLKTAGQLALDRLPISEFYAVGGPDYGRAFPVAAITGDNGIAGSAELAWHPKDFPIDRLAGSEVYGFIDGGETWLLGRGGNPGQEFDLASAGAGVRLAVFKNSVLQLEGARELDVPPFLKRSWTFEFAINTLQN